MQPQFDLLLELIEDVARVHPLRADLTVERAARLTHSLVLSAVHSRLLGPEGEEDIPAETLWRFCVAGMGVEADEPRSGKAKKAPSRRRTASGRS